MTYSTPITVAYGDGIGPETMEAALFIMKEAGARLAIETIEIGERIYNMGAQSGLLPSAWDSLHRTKILLKAPTINAPKGRTSVNDALLAAFSMYDYHFHAPDEYAGSVSKFGAHFAVFEPHYIAALRQTGKNAADPSGMIHAATMMLHHIGQGDVAITIQNAWQCTIQEGIHTPGRYKWGKSKQKANTREFAGAVAERLGKKPSPQG